MSLSRLLTPRTTARHAKPSALGPVLLAGGLTAAFVLAEGAVGAGAASAASADDFSRLRGCESGGNYSTNTGNGFYGAYQFDQGTWNGLGYSGLPSNASAGTQDAAARTLQSQRGWQPWPACSRKLGLGSGSSSTSRSSGVSRASTPTRVSRPVVSTHHLFTPGSARAAATQTVAPTRTVAPTTPPRFAGHVFTVKDIGSNRADVRAWQQRMVARGWDLAVDGYFGPQSAGIATAFADEKGLDVRRGTVDKSLFNAAWRLRVT